MALPAYLVPLVGVSIAHSRVTTISSPAFPGQGTTIYQNELVGHPDNVEFLQGWGEASAARALTLPMVAACT